MQIARALQTPLAFLATATRGSAAAIHAAPNAGSPVADVFPPKGTSPNSTLFPPDVVVGYPGPTVTGAEAGAIETAAAYPYNTGPANQFPLVTSEPHGEDQASTFNIQRYWGNLSPWYSLSSADYGLPDTSPLVPGGCDITQVHLLYRHGARYPTSGTFDDFQGKIANASKAGFSVSGDLKFLATWKYKLGAELLTPFGRSQNFLLGVEHRILYGHLLNKFTEAGKLPVFRTESQNRMVKTAENFAAGFFGVPEYMNQVNIEILVENDGVNNSGAPYDVCPNANIDSRGAIGSTVAANFANDAFNTTLHRLNSLITGLTFTPTDVVAMLQLCSYETNALGYSPFCDLFTKEDFMNYEYFYDIAFYYNNGPGSPVAAAQGKAYLQEFVARFTREYPAPLSALNETFDNTSTYFPLDQSIYADATHEVVVLDTLVAFNLTALFAGPPLSAASRLENKNNFVASKVVPFATHFTVQVLECPAKRETKQIRFLVNDAVIPVHDTYAGCEPNAQGMCAFDTVVDVLKKRIDEIDFDHDCYGNYTAEPGMDYNGRAPRSGAVKVHAQVLT